MYVGVAVTNERIEIDSGEWAVGSSLISLRYTGRMTRLIWVYAGRTGHFVGFVMRRLICNLGESNERARFGVLLAS